MKKILLIILIFYTNLILAQDSYEYFGVIKLNGNDKTVISYRLVFNEHNGKISGYSVTDLDGEHETKNVISGTYNSKSKIFSFKEDEILYTKSKFTEKSFCFVNFSGKIKLVNKNSKVDGDFKGLYKNNKSCINGTISLIGSEKIYRQMTKLSKKIDKTKRIDEKTKEYINPFKQLDSLKINKLLKDQNLNVFWKSKKFKMEIFDAGKVDGDIINVYHNNKVILSNYKIIATKKIIDIVLVAKENEFILEAINEGTITPNTAKIILIDDVRTFELMSNLKKDEKASITIIKKEL
ncbi:MAG: hypothetical protein ACI924_001809 [Flavobacterium sp.]|jgi:hypothetical protein